MGEFTKDPGGHKVVDPGGGIGMYDPNPAEGYIKDPGTGI